MHRGLLLLPIALAACGRHPPLRVIEPGPARVDAGHVTRPPSGCTVAFGGPSCCAPDGRRVSSATCVNDDYVCSEGSICECVGEPQDFYCSDFCGSDAYVDPICGAAGWVCPAGLTPTNACPAGTCWGEPGGLCIAPQCVNGAWTCASEDGGINDPPET